MLPRMIATRLDKRIESIRQRIERLILAGTLGAIESKELEERLVEVTLIKANTANSQDTEEKITRLEIYIDRLLSRAENRPLLLEQEKAEKVETSSTWMFWLSLVVLLLLLAVNLASIIWSPATANGSRYVWPKGWFNSFAFIGFAAAGVAVNLLLSLLPIASRKDWDRRQHLGTWAFRLLQATVYSAVIYHFVSKLPAQCPQADPNCLDRSLFPFEVTGLFIGMFIDSLERAFVGVGERFVDAIASLFAIRFEAPSKRNEVRQDLDQKREQLIRKYAEMDKGEMNLAQRQVIESLFKETLLLLQSFENDRAADRLQEIELKLIGNTKQPLSLAPMVKVLTVDPAVLLQGQDNRLVILRGEGFRNGLQVKVKKDQETFDATDIVLNSETEVQCKFPVPQMSAGVWDVAVVIDSLEYLLPKSVEIRPNESDH